MNNVGAEKFTFLDWVSLSFAPGVLHMHGYSVKLAF